MAENVIVTRKITVYGVTWCGDCRRARTVLDQSGIEYDWIDIDRDHQAEQFVKQTNGGMRSVPTIIFPDGSILVEPANYELSHKLASIPA